MGKVFTHPLILAVGLGLITLSYTHCADLKLEKIEYSLEAGQKALGGEYTLPATGVSALRHRYIFFLDMSHSMLTAPCASDVNHIQEEDPVTAGTKAVQAASPPAPCTQPSSGSDLNGNRFQVLKAWLQELKEDGKSQVLILPFSGGRMDKLRADKEKVANRPKFEGASEALSYVSDLEQEHLLDKSKVEPEHLGTSVPFPRAKLLYDLLNVDMKAQADMGTLLDTMYDVFYITDGVPAPTVGNAQTALKLVNFSSNSSYCPLTCVTDPSKDSRCQDTSANSNGTNKCFLAMGKLREYWGEPMDNEIAPNVQRWRGILELVRTFNEGGIRLHLVSLGQDLLPAKLKLPERNFLYALKSHLSIGTITEIKSPQPPFKILGKQNRIGISRLRSAFVMNPNVRVNKQGKLDVDSDGDGLFDSEEKALNTDPYLARTSGFCLDSMKVRPEFAEKCGLSAKALDCIDSLDADGDGLNQCEELIGGTDDRMFDFDHDTIPDSLEIVYGFNPLKSDVTTDANGDNYSNLANFTHGLGPDHYLATIPAGFHVNFQNEFLGLTATPEGTTPLYKAKIDPFPAARTGLIKSVPKLYRSPRLTPETVIPEENSLISGVLHNETNRVVILMSAYTSQDPKKIYWYIKKQDVSVEDLEAHEHLDFNGLKMFETLDEEP